ncbi:MAG: ATP-binding cassette domain-containing protein [Gammaproteobacteria bacterium]|nr:ATP-binding cassette domain-containing protein [Gammaproteobacteria bacterium]
MRVDDLPVISAVNLCKSFSKTEVVRGIDFVVEKGRCYGFLGPNGAGKTTTLSMIEGVSPMTSGELSVFEYVLPQQGALARARMGIVPQMDNLDPDFSVIENLRVYGSYFRIPKKILEPRISELLDFMQLSDRANEKPDNLSGGMKRRLTIARALINDPELIILDEPTTGLDPQVRHVIWAQLRKLMQSGKTILMTTHYMDEAERLCDELFIMDNGVILDRGSPRIIIDKHVERYVVELSQDNVELKGKLKNIPDVRLESHGDALFCYCNEQQAVNDLLSGYPEIQYYFRPCNLEDVFLNMTGRELRE